MFDTVNHFEVVIPTPQGSGDVTDIYYPVVSDSEEVCLPLALLLQGAMVDKGDYANFASMVASYGFVVVVPNVFRTVFNPIFNQEFSGLIAEVEQISRVLAYMEADQFNNDSPVQGKVDLSLVGLLGHSWGGAVGLSAIQNICLPLFCSGSFARPKALKAGIFYGTTFRDQSKAEVVLLPIDNQQIPVGLIVGDRDGVIQNNMEAVIGTYNNIKNPPKALITVLGANHYGITNEDSNRDPVRPTLDQKLATEAIARWSALFLRAHLIKDSEAFNQIYHGSNNIDTNVMIKSDI